MHKLIRIVILSIFFLSQLSLAETSNVIDQATKMIADKRFSEAKKVILSVGPYS